MNDILKTYMERFRENRHTLRRYTAFVLALAMITTLFVNWQLHGVGISMTAQYQCGEEEHTHTADCYTKVLTCGYEEGELENADEVAAAAATSQPTVEAEPMPLSLEPQIEFVPHAHTEDCYTEVQTLPCMEEAHVHDDDCFDPEDGSLICDIFEHTHDESREQHFDMDAVFGAVELRRGDVDRLRQGADHDGQPEDGFPVLPYVPPRLPAPPPPRRRGPRRRRR